MAEIIESGGGKKHGGKKRPKKHSSHIDMTPMVDLACLLLTFFMLTTAFSKPKVMEIVLPEKIKDTDVVKDQKIDDSKVVNILLANGKVYWYNGLPEANTVLTVSNFSKDGIRKMLLSRNKDLYVKIDQFNQKILKGKIKLDKAKIDKQIEEYKTDDKKGPIVLIKAGKDVKYGNIVDVIDEMAICNIARYAIVDIQPAEIKLIENLGVVAAPAPVNNKKN